MKKTKKEKWFEVIENTVFGLCLTVVLVVGAWKGVTGFVLIKEKEHERLVGNIELYIEKLQKEEEQIEKKVVESIGENKEIKILRRINSNKYEVGVENKMYRGYIEEDGVYLVEVGELQ